MTDRHFGSSVAKSLRGILSAEVPSDAGSLLIYQEQNVNYTITIKIQQNVDVDLAAQNVFMSISFSNSSHKARFGAVCFNINFFHRTFVTYRK